MNFVEEMECEEGDLKTPAPLKNLAKSKGRVARYGAVRHQVDPWVHPSTER
jgi:hypothetical protein